MAETQISASRTPFVSWAGSVAKNRVFLSFAALVVLWLGAVLFVHGFASVSSTQYLLQTASYLGIIALGQTLVIVMGGIDLSVSAVVALSAVVCAQVSSTSGPVAGILAALLASVLVGLGNAAGVSYLRIPPLVMTLASGTILGGVLLIYTNGSPKAANIPLLNSLANNSTLGVPNAFLLWLAFVLVTLWLLHAASVGRYGFALGSNNAAAKASGVPVRATTLIVYAACALLSGCSGLVLLGFTDTSSLTMGAPYQLLSIVAVVLGGTSILGGKGHLLGTVSGALLLTVLVSMLSALNFSSAARTALLGILIILLLLSYSRETRQ
jgi:ribose transport system permease protein